MVKFSRFTHIYDLGDSVALYHSLRMKPVYLLKNDYQSLQDWMASSAECIPSNLNFISDLFKYKIIIHSDAEDEKVLQFVKSRIPRPAISVCYLITSEQCNLACKYCFLGNNDRRKRQEFLTDNMTIETSDAAIDFFIDQIKKSGIDPEINKPALIFYGGEPLVNYPIVEHVADRINKLRAVEPCIKNLEMSMVTNGLLLNESRLTRLHELGVAIAISLDGFTAAANEMRVDTNGKPVFNKILNTLDICENLGINISLSVTLSEETIKDTKSILKLISDYNIKGFGFNILMSSDTFVVPDEYNEKAAQFIIDEFIELRKLGIYEDRIMRKLKSFMRSQIYFSDCAATSGSQIVIAPNGQVGICHGCLYNKKYFVTNISDKTFDAATNESFIEWSQLTPINRDACLTCPALGICGGGCPINATYLKPSNTIHSVDERFCVHALKTLDFFIKDLYRIMKEHNGKDS